VFKILRYLAAIGEGPDEELNTLLVAAASRVCLGSKTKVAEVIGQDCAPG
jgi:hypothetical protein